MKNIIAAIFATESEGYQAMTQLRQLPPTENAVISQMALVKRDEKGFKICDSYDSGINTTNDTVIGGLVGSLIGVLGGPIGMLLMGSYGVLVGGTMDTMDAVAEDLLIETVAGKMVEGETALIALADEKDEAYLDSMLSGYKVEIARFDAAVVAEEVDEAMEVEKELARLARVELRNQKKKERPERIAHAEDHVEETLAKIDNKLSDKLVDMDEKVDEKLHKLADRK